MAQKIKKDDDIIVISGKDKGKKGKVLKVLRDVNRVLVGGIAQVKRHQKPTQANPGGIVTKTHSIHVSNVALMDPKDQKATRVGFKILADGKKVRVAKRSGETI